MRRVVVVVFALSPLPLLTFGACSSFGSGETPLSDASVDAGSDADADAEPLGPCDLDRPFEPPVALEIGTSSIEAARPVNDNTNDILSAKCGTSGILTSCDLYRTTLADLGSDKGKLAISLVGVEDSFPTIHERLNTIFFARGEVDASPGSPRRLYVAPSDGNGGATLLGIAPGADSDKEPYVVDDTLFFVRQVGPAARVWSAKVSSPGLADEAKELSLPFQGNLYAPVVSKDLKEVFVAIEGTPKFLLKGARRTAVTESFVESLAAFSSLPADPVAYPVWLSTNRCTLWAVTKATGSTHGRLQVFNRPVRR